MKRKFKFFNFLNNQRKQPLNFSNFLKNQMTNQNKDQEDASASEIKNIKKSTFFKYKKNEIN